MAKSMKLSAKLVALFVLIGLVPFLITGVLFYQKSTEALRKNAVEKLAFIQSSKQMEVERYFTTVKRQTITLSENLMVVQAMKALTVTFDTVEKTLGEIYETNRTSHEERLKSRYGYQQEKTRDAGDGAASMWFPKSLTSRILQHLYISSNAHPIGEKQRLGSAGDASDYSATHALYHPVLRDFVEKFGYYDLFLITPDTKDVVYSVFKEVDFATSLLDGPYANTHFSRVVKAASEANHKDALFFADFKPYVPSYNSAAAFIASPIFDGDKKIGVLALQLSLDAINHIMTNDRRWREVGMGATGESFLVGPDHLLRSDVRFLIEDSERFVQQLRETGVARETVEAVRQHRTAVGNLRFEVPAPKTDAPVMTTLDYRRVPVLLSQGVVTLPDNVQWRLVATMALEEAFETPEMLRWMMWALALIISTVVIVAGWFFARSLSGPLSEVTAVLSSVSSEIAVTVNQHERIASQQSASVNETNTTMEELHASARQSAKQAEAASDSAERVLSFSEAGSQKSREMTESMVALKEKSSTVAQQILNLSEQINKIGEITVTVSDFANETKMLAMNAAVEAVRAGEHGKGFSVLSGEIRRLAEESRRSAERIHVLIQDIQKATTATVMAAEEGDKTVEASRLLAHSAGDAFDSVSHDIRSTSESAQQISLNVNQQAVAVKQVLEAMNAINVGAKESSSGITQIKVGMNTLNNASQKLKAMV